MSDPAADTGASGPTSPCCAAMAEMQRRARQRKEQHDQAENDVASGTPSPEPKRVRSAPEPS
ncbi:hypothetical protein CXR04_27415 [Streptomyces sp. CMB-StM0423]|nr:hypothetical protein CXR04_27415 [Streptomyces sp. CMB-StM0423]